MEAASIDAPIIAQPLSPHYFTYDDQALGCSIIDQYIYVFFSQKIRVYEQLINSNNPQIIEQIYIPNKKIKKFTVSQEFIGVVFQDNGVEVRARQYWQVVQCSANIPKQVIVKSLQICEKRLMYKYIDNEGADRQNYGFIDISCKQSLKTWENSLNIQKLVHKSQLNGINDFYLTLEDNKVKFGLFYQAQQQFKAYQLGEMPQQKQNILDIKILDTQISNIPDNHDYQVANVDQTNKIFLIKLCQSQSTQSSTRQFKVKYQILYQEALKSKEEEPDDDKSKQNKMRKQYEKVEDFLIQVEKKTKQFSQKVSEETQLLLDSDPGSRFQRFIINNVKSLIYVVLTNRIYQMMMTSEYTLKINKIYSKQPSDKLLGIGDHFFLLQSPSWRTACFSSNLSIIKEKQMIEENQTSTMSPSILKEDKELQTDALDQFDEKYMNQMIDKLFERKRVCEYGVQTQQDRQKVEVEKVELLDKQTQTQQQVQEQIIKKEIFHYHHELIKYFPNEEHSEKIKKLNINFQQVNNSIEYKLSTRITQLIKNEHQKLKQNCLLGLKKICQKQIASSITPIIENKLTQIFQAKLYEINQYIYSLSIENLFHLRDQFEKDRVNQQMLQNQLMKRQIHEVQEYKKVVHKLMEINKVREIQKIVFFEQVTKKFVEIEARMNNLQQKTQFTINQENQNQIEIVNEIDNIKNLLRSGKNKKVDPISSEEDSEGESQGTDKDYQQSEGQSEDSNRSQSHNSGNRFPMAKFHNKYVSSQSYHPNQLRGSTYQQGPMFMNGPGQFGPPISYHQQPFYPAPPNYNNSYNPYHNSYPLSYTNYPPPGQGPYHFVQPSFEHGYSSQGMEKKKKRKSGK